jgi:hypothetical protein
MSVRFRVSHPGLLVLAVAGAASLLPATSAQAQRRIEGQRYGGGPLYQNPAGRALGSGSVNTPDGILGQNAMGAGDALDSNLQVGSGGRNFRRASGYGYEAVQARNLVVTNGVAGGRGFRGYVDYVAPGDFSGLTADRVGYDFRRDSALSGLEFVTSSQQQDAFNIAQGVGVFQYRRDFTSLPEINSVSGAERLDDAQIRLDRASSNLTTRNLLTTAVAPSDVGYVQIAADRVARMTSSPVRGIQFESADPSAPRTTFDQALANDAYIQGDDLVEAGLLPRPFEMTREVAGAPDSAPVDERITSPASGVSKYQEILQRVWQDYEGRSGVALDPAGMDRMRRDFDRLGADPLGTPRIGTSEDVRPEAESGSRAGLPGERREGLPGDRREGLPGERRPGLPGERTQAPGLDLGPADGEGVDDGSVFPPTPEVSPPGGGDPAASDSGDSDETSTVRTTEELVQALAHRTQVSELVDPRMRARVAALVEQAEAAMREKDYFRAEDRFEIALKLNPGNPILEGGRANAQIGAGLYRSAGVTLIGLFRRHEAMIDVGFDADLLPSPTRLRLAAQTIEAIIERDPDGSSGMGVVIAYIGRQLGDRTMIRSGLDAVDDPQVNSLVPQLRKVWLAEKPIPGIGDDPASD